jgi:hypothetical protein
MQHSQMMQQSQNRNANTNAGGAGGAGGAGASRRGVPRALADSPLQLSSLA